MTRKALIIFSIFCFCQLAIWGEDYEIPEEMRQAMPSGARERHAKLRQTLCDNPYEIDPRAQGSYFRRVAFKANSKAESQQDFVPYGITGAGILPQFKADFDQKRYFLPEDPKMLDKAGPLDRASVYVGAQTRNGYLKFDAGLIWDRVYRVYQSNPYLTYTDLPSGSDGGDFLSHQFILVEKMGSLELLDGSNRVTKNIEKNRTSLKELQELGLRPNFAYRPFWRTTNGYRNQWRVPPEGSLDNIYFYPGMKFKITLVQKSVFDTRTAWMKPTNFFHVEVEEIKKGAPRSFKKDFVQEGFLDSKRIFRRVNAIDQFYVDQKGERKTNERNPVIRTKAEAIEARWEYTFLLGPRGDYDPPLALSAERCVVAIGKDVETWHKRIFYAGNFNEFGGESLDIAPSMQR